MEAPTAAEVAQACSVLRRLQPADLAHAELAELREAGSALFRRHILKERRAARGTLKHSATLLKTHHTV